MRRISVSIRRPSRALPNSCNHTHTTHPTYTTYFSGPEKLEIADLPFTTAGDKPTRREALRYYRRLAGYYDLDVRYRPAGLDPCACVTSAMTPNDG